MHFTFRTTLAVVFAFHFSTALQAKTYSNCSAAFKFYEHDNSRHKAFATTNGSFPGNNDVACGGNGGDDFGRAVYAALTECQRIAKKEHYSGKCQIYRKQ